VPPNAPYPSFVAFVEGVVLPTLLKHTGRKRLDGWEKGGNLNVIGRFIHEGDTWEAHEDCHFEPLLLAYWSAKARGSGPTFRRADTKHGVRLDLEPKLQSLRPTSKRYLYLYLSTHPRKL
jgi:hypothetical protein